MPREIADIEIEATKPGETSPFVTIPSDDIGSVSIDERAHDGTSTGTIVIENADDSYSGSDRITSGDKLTVKTQLDGEASLTGRWTAMTRTVADDGWLSPRESWQELVVEADGFVFATLGWRTVEASFEDEDPADIVDDLVETEAPEIGRGQIEPTGQTTDAFYSGRFLRDVVLEDQAAIGDAFVSQDGTDLVFEPLGDKTPKHDLTPDDVQADVSLERNDARIANRVRVDGGEDHAIDDEQTDQDDTETVTDTDRITHQLSVRKSEVARIQVWTQPTGSGDPVTVRLQANDDGSPVAPDDPESDIARRELQAPFLADGDFTTFLMPSHTLAPGEGPWMIIESGENGGQDIGVNDNDVPTFRAEFPFPLITRAINDESLGEYRRRDKRETDEQLDTETAVRDRARAVADHNGQPEVMLEASAASDRAHNLRAAEAVTVPDAAWPGDVPDTFIVLERTTEYANGLLQTELTLQDIDSV